jgi:hypothetical protein
LELSTAVVAEALFAKMKVQRASKLTGASERLAALVAAALADGS